MIPLRLAAYGVAAAVVIATYHFTPLIGPHARLERLAEDRDGWKEAAWQWELAAGGWQKSFRKAERLRAEEQVQAVAAVNETALQCDARVKQARASAKKIKELVYAPAKNDAAGCPVRGLLDAGRVRDAIGAKPPG